jgi:hypothetical protein
MGIHFNFILWYFLYATKTIFIVTRKSCSHIGTTPSGQIHHDTKAGKPQGSLNLNEHLKNNPCKKGF